VKNNHLQLEFFSSNIVKTPTVRWRAFNYANLCSSAQWPASSISYTPGTQTPERRTQNSEPISAAICPPHYWLATCYNLVSADGSIYHTYIYLSNSIQARFWEAFLGAELTGKTYALLWLRQILIQMSWNYIGLHGLQKKLEKGICGWIDNVLSGRKLNVMTVQSPRLPILFAAALSYGQRWWWWWWRRSPEV